MNSNVLFNYSILFALMMYKIWHIFYQYIEKCNFISWWYLYISTKFQYYCKTTWLKAIRYLLQSFNKHFLNGRNSRVRMPSIKPFISRINNSSISDNCATTQSKKATGDTNDDHKTKTTRRRKKERKGVRVKGI